MLQHKPLWILLWTDHDYSVPPAYPTDTVENLLPLTLPTLKMGRGGEMILSLAQCNGLFTRRLMCLGFGLDKRPRPSGSPLTKGGN